VVRYNNKNNNNQIMLVVIEKKQDYRLFKNEKIDY